ncbi:MAG: hypothetical protein GY953_41060 [bacterium]|nr:hypothetical protein [bacterium]
MSSRFLAFVDLSPQAGIRTGTERAVRRPLKTVRACEAAPDPLFSSILTASP